MTSTPLSKALLSLSLLAAVALPQPVLHAQASTASAAKTSAPGVPLTPAQLSGLLPATVFFRGQTAPIQQRNAGAVRFHPDSVTFATLVDTSGYSTGVQETYQFYFVTETPILVGGKPLAAGAYGGGFLADGSVEIMDIGGHSVLRSSVQTDSALARPRPLQIVAQDAQNVRLYLGRRYVTLTDAPR